MIKLVSQFDNFTEKAGVATPSGGKCCCCSCCCCLVTASTAIHLQGRYLEQLDRELKGKILDAKNDEGKTAALKEEIMETMSRRTPFFYKFIIWGTILFQLIIGTLLVGGYFFSSLFHTFHFLGVIIFIGIILMFGWTVHAIYVFYRIRRKVDPQVKLFSYKELSFKTKLLYVLLLWGAGFGEMILLIRIAFWNGFL